MDTEENASLRDLVCRLEEVEESIQSLLIGGEGRVVIEKVRDDGSYYYQEMSKLTQNVVRAAAVDALREEVSQIKRAIREAAD